MPRHVALLATSLLFLIASHAYSQEDPNIGWDDRFASPGGPGTNGTVNAIASSGDQIYLGGDFSVAGGIQARNIARWDGTQWAAMGAGIDGIVSDILVSGEDVYVVGEFTRAGEADVLNVARWDGGSWSALGQGIASSRWWHIDAIAELDGKIMVDGPPATSGLTAGVSIWDGTSWTRMADGPNGDVNEFTLADGVLYASGSFSMKEDGDWKSSGIASFDGSSWSRLGTWDCYCHSVAADDDYVYVTENGRLRIWDGVSWKSPDQSDTTIRNSLTIHEGRLVGYDFSLETIVYWDDQWVELTDASGAILPEINHVRDISSAGDKLLFGGEFLRVGGEVAGGVISLDANGLRTLDGQNRPGFGLSGDGTSLASDGQTLYAAGSLELAGTVPVRGIARWTGDAWEATGESGLHYVINMEVDGTNLYANDAGGQFGKWDGTDWTMIEVPWHTHVRSFTVRGDSMVVGDHDQVIFYDGETAKRLGSALPGRVNDLEIHGNLLVAAVSGNPIHHFDGTTWQPATGSISSARKLRSVGSRLFAHSYDELAEYTEEGWKTIQGLDGMRAMMEVGGELFVGGLFDTEDGRHDGVARWSGSEWEFLGDGIDGPVEDLVWHQDALWAIGDFNFAGGKESANIARWSPSGPSGTSIEHVTDAHLNLEITGPHPVTDRLSLQLTSRDAGTVGIEVFDAMGRLVLPKVAHSISGGSRIEVSMRLDGLTPGAYFVRLSGDDGQVVRSVIKGG